MTLLRRRRVLEGLTQSQLARRIGVSQAAVQSWEAGRFDPSPRHIKRLAKALAVTTDELIQIINPDREMAVA